MKGKYYKGGREKSIKLSCVRKIVMRGGRKNITAVISDIKIM